MLLLEIHHCGLQTDIAFSEVERLFASFMFTANCCTLPSNGSQVFCNISGATPVQPFKWFTSLLQYFRRNTSTTLQMVHKSFAIFQEQHQYNPSNGSQVFCNISGATPVQPFKWFTSLLQYFRSNTSTTLQMVHKSFAIFQEQHQYNPSNGSQVFCNISGATPVQPFKWFTSLLQYFRSNTSTTLQMVHKSFAIFQAQHQYNPSNGSQVFCNISGATPVQPFKWFTSLLQYFRSNTSTTLQMVHKSFAIFQAQHQYNPSNGSQVFCNISGATPVQPFKWFTSLLQYFRRNTSTTLQMVHKSFAIFQEQHQYNVF